MERWLTALGASEYESQFRAFDRARTLRGNQRVAYLDEACGKDTELRRAVDALLEYHDGGSGSVTGAKAKPGLEPLAEQFAEMVAGKERDPVLPERIGPYRVLRRIGAGGMGVVYEAEQRHPSRRVALKVLHPALAHGDRLRRFRKEAEVLARLHHPGIAQVFAAETIDQGHGEQPWFAMELIEGRPLVDDAQRRGLDRRGRVELVAAICDAVQHAHERGIVHRDLKPDNILVEPGGRPKVLDFGIARSSETGAGLSTLHTGQGEILGTVTHMAPEQLRGEANSVGPAVDVWALGIVLFELLTDSLPYELAGLPLTAAVQLLSEQRPKRLSEVHRTLRGDLETIVSKALEAEPHRRYASPAALAADLRRWLGSEPIAARRASLLYRASRFAKRKPASVALIGTVALAVLAIARFAVLEGRARRAAEAGQLRADESSAFLRASLYAANQTAWTRDPFEARKLIEGVQENERGWVWNWLASRSPLYLPRGTEMSGGNNIPPPQFLDERNLLELTWTSYQEADFVTIDLTEPYRSTRHTEGLKILGARTALIGHHFLGRRLLDSLVVDTRTWSVKPSAKISGNDPTVLAQSVHGAVLGSNGSGSSFELQVAWPDSEEGPAKVSGAEYYSSGYRWSPDGGWIAFASYGERFVHVLDGRTLRTVALFEGKRGGMRVNWSPDSTRLAVAECDAFLTVMGIPGFEPLVRVDLPDEQLFSIGWNRSGTHLGVLSEFGFRSFDPETGDLLQEVPLQTSDPSSPRSATERPRVPFAHSPSGRLLSTYAAHDFHPWILDLEALGLEGHRSEGHLSTELGDWAYRVAVSPDGDLLATACPTQREILVHDAWSGSPIARLPSDPKEARLEADMMSWLSFDRAGNAVALVTHEQQDPVRVLKFDLLDGSTSRGPARSFHSIWQLPSELLEDFRSATGLVAPDLNHAITIRAEDGAMWMGNPATPNSVSAGMLEDWPASTIPGFALELPDPTWKPRCGIWGIDVSPDGETLAITTSYVVRLCDADSGRTLRRLPLPDSATNFAVRFSPDGALLALGSRSGSITLYDTEYWVELLAIDAHDDYVYDLAWSPDGSRLFSVGGDAKLRIWDSVHPIAGHFRAEDRAERKAAARERLAELTAALGDPAEAARALMAECKGDADLRIAARRACLEAWQR